jgi:ribosomal protein S1
MKNDFFIDLEKYFTLCSNGQKGKIIAIKNGSVYYSVSSNKHGVIKITDLDKEDQEKVKKFLNTKQKAIA